MKLETAQAAAPLAARIIDRQRRIQEITDDIAANCLISRVEVTNPTTGVVTSILLDVLDQATSSQALKFALGVYQAQLAELMSELDAL